MYDTMFPDKRDAVSSAQFKRVCALHRRFVKPGFSEVHLSKEGDVIVLTVQTTREERWTIRVMPSGAVED